MKNKYPHIFEPMTIRRMTVKNRIVMTPMGTNYGEQNGEMSFLHINYYEQRAIFRVCSNYAKTYTNTVHVSQSS